MKLLGMVPIWQKPRRNFAWAFVEPVLLNFHGSHCLGMMCRESFKSSVICPVNSGDNIVPQFIGLKVNSCIAGNKICQSAIKKVNFFRVFRIDIIKFIGYLKRIHTYISSFFFQIGQIFKKDIVPTYRDNFYLDILIPR